MMIRYFSLVAPGAVGDIGYAYLQALAATGIRVRALPIGPASAIGTERRWYQAGKLFTTPMSIPFVNVVCAPMGMMLGTRAPMSALGGTKDLVKQEGQTTDVMVFPPELRDLLGTMGNQRDASDVVYEPQTALGGLYTVDCKNLAIISGMIDSVAELFQHDIRAMESYDLVMSPSESVCNELVKLGIKARYVPPDAGQLEAILEEICSGLGTFAIGDVKQVMDERRGITWLRSNDWMTSSSRSVSLEMQARPPPSLATSTSTSSVFRTIRSWVTRTSRSIMRFLAFWRR